MTRKFTLILTIALSSACGGVVDDPAAPGNTGSEPTTEPTETSDPSTLDEATPEEQGADVEEVELPEVDPDEEVRLTTIHESIFVAQGCTAGYCHGSFGLGSPADVVEAFVDVEASQPTCGRTHYVVPGDPEASILWVRVRPLTDEDIECEVTKMPKGSETGLDADTAQFIYDWIADGALL